ncbi:hypothetical protein QOT17_008848 [Balamuthia mandrillaris]
MRFTSFCLVLLAAVQVMMASSKEICNEPADCSSAFDDCIDTAAEEPNEVCKCYGALKVCIGMCYGWAAHQAACADACYMSQSTCSTGRWVQPMGGGSRTSSASRLSGEWLVRFVYWFCLYM